KIKSLIPQTFLMTLILGSIIGALLIFYFDVVAVFLFGDIEEHTFNYAKDYFKIRAIGLPISLLIALFFGVFRGFQNTSWAMYISLIGGVINIFLDVILIHGFGDSLKPMGVEGAAWASLTAQAVMLVLCIVFYLSRTPFGLALSPKINPYFREMITIFLNMFIRTLVLNIVFIMANRYANHYGEEELAAYTVGYNIWIFTSFFIDGYSNAGNALAGKFLGENSSDKLQYLGKKLMWINIRISFLLMIIYTMSYAYIGNIFNSDETVLNHFNYTFWVIIIAQPFNSIAFTFDGIFKGMGRAKELRNTLIQATFFIFIPTLFLSNLINESLMSIWISLSLWMVYRGGSLLYKFKMKSVTPQ
ncbi:MAG: MATE family efflux transporter, partial [Bacteroidota bacterium]|nr:MATE family efflux transporter [Bacteroidota bacterium]